MRAKLDESMPNEAAAALRAAEFEIVLRCVGDPETCEAPSPRRRTCPWAAARARILGQKTAATTLSRESVVTVQLPQTGARVSLL